LFTVNACGKSLTVNVTGSGKYINFIKYDGVEVPSAVIPYNSKYDKVEIVLGTPSTPYIAGTNSLLEKCNYDEQSRTLDLYIKAFTGHKNITQIISPSKPKEVFIDGDKLIGNPDIKYENSAYTLDINSVYKSDEEKIRIEY
jgi:hypothetical protein